ncbi:putative Transmembrane protein [Quillaja saponaria]|uniref:Transmembrane protein n=1 Tax=Quillaja saponaria TaxID=32244 RepID=A0AAD7L174_QUISA|nr:putative Transmembrane protein [Quillaja saponaria]
MTAFPAIRSLQFQILFFSISLQIIAGLANDPSSSKHENKAESHEVSSSSAGVKIVIVCLGLVAVVSFCFFLFKIWQKKKRQEQHARLLKLFEDDDELEVELGIRE